MIATVILGILIVLLTVGGLRKLYKNFSDCHSSCNLSCNNNYSNCCSGCKESQAGHKNV